MISQELEVSLHAAFVEARRARHEFIAVEHLLLALLDNLSAAEVLKACACNIEDLRKTLRDFIAETTPVLPPSSETNTQPTLGFQRVIQRAIMHVQSTSNGKRKVTGADVLVAIDPGRSRQRGRERLPHALQRSGNFAGHISSGSKRVLLRDR